MIYKFQRLYLEIETIHQYLFYLRETDKINRAIISLYLSGIWIEKFLTDCKEEVLVVDRVQDLWSDKSEFERIQYFKDDVKRLELKLFRYIEEDDYPENLKDSLKTAYQYLYEAHMWLIQELKEFSELDIIKNA